jgi:putative transcription factor
MSDDWDSVTKIGKAVRPGGAAVRPVVARTQAEINAARRAGAVIGTEKKVCTSVADTNPRL